MPFEIERKFLVKPELLPQAAGTLYIQGFLSTDPAAVRARIAGDQGFLTIKGKGEGIKHPEFEYPIPVEDAREMLRLCKEPPIEKIRRVIMHEGHKWEVDEFLGANKGLWMAEIELSDENESFEIPEWAGEEVTHDPRYYNVNLSRNPFSRWGTVTGPAVSGRKP